MNRLGRLLNIRDQELRAVVLSFLYFFSLMSAYYMLRPIRDEMGIAGGVDNLHWLFTATFFGMLLLVPLFGYISKKLSRNVFLPWTYLFIIINLVAFYVVFELGLAIQVSARIFFVWLSVFNLFIVSLLWSFMSDIFSNLQSRRVYGIITAGGSAGAIMGPLLTTTLVKPLGINNLLLISIGFFMVTVFCVYKLIRITDQQRLGNSGISPLGGSIWAGFRNVFHSRFLSGIGLFMILFTMVSTILYFEQAYIVESHIQDSESRTALFGGMDLTVNILAISTQLFLTSRVIQKFGIAIILAMVPLLITLGFLSLSVQALLPVIVVVQVLHRASNFSLLRPCREILFTVTSREDRYKSKNFIDTSVYRGGDALTAWIFSGLLSFGFGLSAIAFFGVFVALAWTATGFFIGNKQELLAKETQIKSAA